MLQRPDSCHLVQRARLRCIPRVPLPLWSTTRTLLFLPKEATRGAAASCFTETSPWPLALGVGCPSSSPHRRSPPRSERQPTSPSDNSAALAQPAWCCPCICLFVYFYPCPAPPARLSDRALSEARELCVGVFSIAILLSSVSNAFTLALYAAIYAIVSLSTGILSLGSCVTRCVSSYKLGPLYYGLAFKTTQPSKH